jgi:hypothetical protein
MDTCQPVKNLSPGGGDHHCHDGQDAICTTKTRDKHDFIIVQEKLDGSNVGIAKVDGKVVALGRSGYEASTSKYEQHQKFAAWVREHYARFDALLREGERLVGEWMLQAHGTRYRLEHEPFVAFDLMIGTERLTLDEFNARVEPFNVVVAKRLHYSRTPCSIERALALLGPFGYHGALEQVEGAVWRVERDVLDNKRQGGGRHRVVDFLTKYVRPDKVDGCYLESVTGKPNVWNEVV